MKNIITLPSVALHREYDSYSRSRNPSTRTTPACRARRPRGTGCLSPARAPACGDSQRRCCGRRRGHQRCRARRPPDSSEHQAQPGTTRWVHQCLHDFKWRTLRQHGVGVPVFSCATGSQVTKNRTRGVCLSAHKSGDGRRELCRQTEADRCLAWAMA